MSAVVVSADEGSLDTDTDAAIVRSVIGLLLPSGGIVVLLEIRRRLPRR